MIRASIVSLSLFICSSVLADQWKGTEERAFNSALPLEQRWQALMDFSKAPIKTRDSVLGKAVHQSEWFLRNGALIAMKNADKKLAVRWAERLLTDRAMIVRVAAVGVLRDLKSNRSAEKMWKALNHPNQFKRGQSLPSRRTTVRALMDLSEDSKKWGRLLKDRDKKIQLLAATKLAEIKKISRK